MSRRNDFIIVAIVCAIVLALLLAQTLVSGRTRDLKTLVADVTMAPDAIEEVTVATPQEAEVYGPLLPVNNEPLKGYIIIGVAGQQYGDPIPMDREKIITLKQDDSHINQVRITREGVEMLSSTCENQDCVLQGEVTPENYKKRALNAFIVCLPNEVSIELIPAQAVQEE